MVEDQRCLELEKEAGRRLEQLVMTGNVAAFRQEIAR